MWSFPNLLENETRWQSMSVDAARSIRTLPKPTIFTLLHSFKEEFTNLNLKRNINIHKKNIMKLTATRCWYGTTRFIWLVFLSHPINWSELNTFRFLSKTTNRAFPLLQASKWKFPKLYMVQQLLLQFIQVSQWLLQHLNTQRRV